MIRQCVGDHGLFVCKQMVEVTISNLRGFDVEIGGRCPDCRRRMVIR